MPLPINPPAGPVSLSPNARTVLEKRYLVKNEKGKPVEQPEDLSWRCFDCDWGATGGRRPSDSRSSATLAALTSPATYFVGVRSRRPRGSAAADGDVGGHSTGVRVSAQLVI